ncbi:ABC transporter permease [Ferrimonas gelatinilytica]|uniref:FtsX-like permease family protein n=1 Tax=Ferrimonas gelatinilytica TaxID=1255257 RepID=A0ABP9S1Z3_9GAMM
MRRHRWLHLWLALGLVLAAALLSGVESLNAAARQSFSQAEKGLDSPFPWRVHSLLSGERIHRDLYLQTVRAGITARPILDTRLGLSDGRWVRLRAEPLPPGPYLGNRGWQTVVDDQLAARAGWREGDVLSTADGQRLPPLALRSDVGPWLLMDIGPAALLADTGPWFSYLALPELTPSQQQWLENQLHDDQVLRSVARSGDPHLLEAFNLNLTALSVLSFLVGLLLAFHALERLVQHRQFSVRILHQLGFTRRQWALALALELILWTAVAGTLGSQIGIALARYLAPGVSDTLVSLYQMERSLQLNWGWGDAVFCFVVLLLAMGIMLLWLLYRERLLARWHRGAVAFAALLVLSLQFTADNQGEALTLLGVTVLLTLLLLPLVLELGSAALARAAPWLQAPLAWGLWDLSASSRRLVVPIAAITLALASAIATRVLVGSFEFALGGFLDTRLHADIYYYSDDATLRQQRPRLEALPAIAEVQTRSQRQGQLEGESVLLKGYGATDKPWPFMAFKSASANWWAELGMEGCLVNEPLAMRKDLRLGQQLTLDSGALPFVCRVAGVFYDYGNPSSELVVWHRRLEAAFGQAPSDGLSLKLAQGVQLDETLEQLQNELDIPAASLIAQRTLRQQANGLFRKTFAITDALAWLTLVVALISWFASLAAQQQGWQHQQAVVSTLGMTRGQIASARLLQLGCQTLLVALVAVASGLVLGWQLVSKVNPLAFGWSMPVQFGSGDWLSGLLMACGVLVLVAVGPIWWQSRSALVGQLSREEV